MICFYHDDLDGKCSAFWVSKWFHSKCADNEDIELIPMNYDKKVPFDSIPPSSIVFIVDFSFNPDDMKKLQKITDNIVWIDHHISAIEKYDNATDLKPIYGMRRVGVAGCALTWLYLFGRSDITNYEEIPHFTKLIADYDTWKFKYGEETKNFISGINSYNTDPIGPTFSRLSTDEDMSFMLKIINVGQSINKYIYLKNEQCCSRNAYEGTFEGCKALIINTDYHNSDIFSSLSSEERSLYDVLIKYNRNRNGKWVYSIYSDKVDVSKLAEKYGGGGHKGAAGFILNELIL